jgi:hypothetical protein
MWFDELFMRDRCGAQHFSPHCFAKCFIGHLHDVWEDYRCHDHPGSIEVDHTFANTHVRLQQTMRFSHTNSRHKSLLHLETDIQAINFAMQRLFHGATSLPWSNVSSMEQRLFHGATSLPWSNVSATCDHAGRNANGALPVSHLFCMTCICACHTCCTLSMRSLSARSCSLAIPAHVPRKLE